MTESDTLDATELFGVTDGFRLKCQEIYWESKTAVELLHQLREISTTPNERDFAMYVFGKGTAINDLRSNPEFVVSLLLGK